MKNKLIVDLRGIALITTVLFMMIFQLVQASDGGEEADRQTMPKNGVNRIGIISLIKKEFYPVYVGFTIFNTYDIAHQSIDIDPNRTIETTFGDIIHTKSKHTRYIPILNNMPDLFTGYQKYSKSGIRFNSDKIKPKLASLFQDNQIDSLLIFYAGSCDDYITSSSEKLNSLGIIRRASIGPDRRYLFACMGMLLVSKNHITILKESGLNVNLKLPSSIWSGDKREPDSTDIHNAMTYFKDALLTKAEHQLEFYGLIPETSDFDEDEF